MLINPIQVHRATLPSAISTGVPLGGFGTGTRDCAGTDISVFGDAKPSTLRADYRPGLPTSKLVAEIRGLLATERRAERLVCRYLADLADRIHARQDAELVVYDDELDATRHFFGLSARDTRERIRVGRALRQLPEIERAFIDGQLSYSRVREVTRVATAESEPGWLDLARGLDMRSLERRVAAKREAAGAKPGRHDDPHPPARTQWVGPDTVRVTFELSTEAWCLVERAMQQARGARAAGASDGDALEAIARAALSVPRAEPTDAGDRAESFHWSNGADGEDHARAVEPDRSRVEAGGPDEAARGSRAREHGMLATQGETTQGGSATAQGMRAIQGETTQGGSATERAPDRRTDDEQDGIGFADQVNEPAVRLLRIMGRSGGWTLDALIESSGLSVQEVCMAVTLLELGGRVRRRAFAFDPV